MQGMFLHYYDLQVWLIELGDLAESKFDLIWQNFGLILFTIVASLGAEAIYELWSVLSVVLAKLLTVISLGLAVNAQ